MGGAVRAGKKVGDVLATNSHREPRGLWLTVTLALALASASVLCPLAARADDNDDKVSQRVLELGLPSFAEPIVTHYSGGTQVHALQVATNLAAMRSYYRRELGIQTPVTLAVLNSNDWMRLSESVLPYGMPFAASGAKPTVFMPAQGGIVFDGIMKTKASLTPEQEVFLKEHRLTFESVADQQVQSIAFHELGHILLNAYGIDPRCKWLNEFLATYFWQTFTVNEQGNWTIAGKFPQAPASNNASKRPKHTTLADFEELYSGVDDYVWYQVQFGTRASEVQSKLGLDFLRKIKRSFPADSGHSVSKEKPLSPEESLSRLEQIAPGFKDWAEVFRDEKSSKKE